MVEDILLNLDLKKYSKNSLCFKPVKTKNDIDEKDFGKYDGYFISSDEKQIRSFVASLKDRGGKMLIAVLGRDDVFNRRVLETIKINYLVSPERINFHGRDTLKQRDSGLNHVLAKIARDKGVSIVINVSDVSRLSNKDKKERAVILSKIIQNVKICRKAKCNLRVASFALDKEQIMTKEQLKSFLLSIGASSQQTKDI